MSVLAYDVSVSTMPMTSSLQISNSLSEGSTSMQYLLVIGNDRNDLTGLAIHLEASI